MFDKLFPNKTHVQILRACYNCKADLSEASRFVANIAGSQASNRSNAAATDASTANAAGSPDATQTDELHYMTTVFLQ